ncbi:hypothetical protein ACO22_02268 [Paracoccidioides brasiliensis]|uniref:Uncharacterized protein n=1 Tax=Paracoccidioides brasiliensis TaxID=121759 RepID=A0A1D2JJ59_PARBR|nr:hypothetical protein ACO22_02268 [Paracoccidioides brasiliensis]ODH52379.1 hypothetical protein GX48_01442 [Paracoccidioides brasiliensis]
MAARNNQTGAYGSILRLSQCTVAFTEAKRNNILYFNICVYGTFQVSLSIRPPSYPTERTLDRLHSEKAVCLTLNPGQILGDIVYYNLSLLKNESALGTLSLA